MDDAGSVCLRKRGGNLDGVVERTGQGQSLGRDRVGEGLALHIFHRNEIQAEFRPHFVHRHDIGVAQRRCGARLTHQPLHTLRVGRVLRRK